MSLLEVVNEHDEVIGIKPRAEIHEQGLRHREVHVWLVTPDGQVVFQKRSASKESYPNMLDATAGGHVEIGQTYLQSALMELDEETGLKVKPEELIEITKLNKRQIGGGIQNIVFRTIYMLPWQGKLSDLKIEEADGAGFVLIPIADILQKTESTSGEIIPGLFTPDYMPIWHAIATHLQLTTHNSQL